MKQKQYPNHHTNSIKKKPSHKQSVSSTKKQLEENLLVSKENILAMVSNGENLLHQLVSDERINELSEYLPCFVNTKKWIEEGKIKDGLTKDGLKKFYTSKMLNKIYEYIEIHTEYLPQRNKFIASINKATGQLPNCNRKEKIILPHTISSTTYFPSNYKLIPINRSAGRGIKH